MQTIGGKVVILGAQDVGKTSIITRYTKKGLSCYVSPTIGASFTTCYVTIENTKIKLQVWDTAGQERFKSMALMYYRNANAALLVFDLTRYKTFQAVKYWVSELKRNVEEAMVLVVIGNKSDLTDQRQVQSEEAREYAQKIGATYHETSAFHYEGIDDVFFDIALGIAKLDSIDFFASNKSYESTSSGSAEDTIYLTPSSEEVVGKQHIAHGISEKPFTCC